MDAMNALYPKVADGGYVIIDDYGAIPACAKAIHDYFDAHGITAPLYTVDWTGRYFRKGDTAANDGGPVAPVPELDSIPAPEPPWFSPLRRGYHALLPVGLRKGLRDVRRSLLG
jgi:hypothetical protein